MIATHSVYDVYGIANQSVKVKLILFIFTKFDNHIISYTGK